MLFAIKFREKGEKIKYTSIIFNVSISEVDSKDYRKTMELGDKHILNFLQTQDDYDIDKRTIKWAGGAIPLGDNQVVLYGDLDEMI